MLCPPRAIHRGGLGSKPLECHAEERQCLHVGSEARCDLTPASSFSCISRPRLRSALRGGPLGALAHVLCGAPSDSRSRSRPECSFAPCAPLCWGFYCNFLISEIDLPCTSWSLARPQAAWARGPSRALDSAGCSAHALFAGRSSVSSGLACGRGSQRSPALASRESVVGPRRHCLRGGLARRPPFPVRPGS